ncbi:hypothetical protein [Aliarcobacter vitoriensis]|uniref:Uncharacterized protein n=1 Tax=Aliarcobacter vitoriensis TaxID=2011099 RepID=A0A366MQ05_9BACT|nr:hypothetical protein [Aliarcobacter vitoriensis]RBQ28368.1 hypothetical protein CRU91_09775 [Aliarcobacter vitoriensis]
MKLLLICNTAIIEHIFSLVCKRLKIELIIQNTNSVSAKYDLIIIDQPFLDSKFIKIKRFAQKIGAISAEELPFDKPRDFLIPRPFLPTKLESLLKEQIEIIKQDQKDNIGLSHFVTENEEDIVTPLVDFINDELEDNIEFEVEEDYIEEDESIVSLSALQKGGVLDNTELNKINTILEDTSTTIKEEDWKDISQIIDEALDEVKDYEFELNEEEQYHLILSKFKIDDLKPLLTKLNQDLVDKLSRGETIDIKISLKDEQ